MVRFELKGNCVHTIGAKGGQLRGISRDALRAEFSQGGKYYKTAPKEVAKQEVGNLRGASYHSANMSRTGGVNTKTVSKLKFEAK